MVLYKIDWSLKIMTCEVVKETPKTFKVQNGCSTSTVRKVDLGSFDGVYVCYALSIAELKTAYRKRTIAANETLSKRIKTNNDNLNIVNSL
jgi:hypothetical protein